MGDLVKIFFKIEPDEDGYPDVGSESVWAKDAGSPDAYIIDNIPFFAREASLGDTVRVTIRDGVRWFDAVISESPNSLMRVFLIEPPLMVFQKSLLISAALPNTSSLTTFSR